MQVLSCEDGIMDFVMIPSEGHLLNYLEGELAWEPLSHSTTYRVHTPEVCCARG